MRRILAALLVSTPALAASAELSVPAPTAAPGEPAFAALVPDLPLPALGEPRSPDPETTSVSEAMWAQARRPDAVRELRRGPDGVLYVDGAK